MRLANGMGSVTKMSGKRRKPWRVRTTLGWTPEGKQIYKNIGTYATRKEAFEALYNWNAQPLSNTDKMKRETVANGLTFADMYNAFLQYKEGKLSDTMISLYRTAYKNLEPLHQQIFVQLKKPHLQDVFDNCKKSSSTKSKMKVLINALYKYATEHELVEKDYSSQIDMEVKKNEKDYQPFSEEEIETIWTHADAGDEVAKIILLQIYTGTRIRELLEIQKENVHLADCYMIGGKKTEAGKNKIEILCNGYASAQQQLFEHFKAITGMDADILDTIGIQKDKVKEALKFKIEGMKNIYWDAAFNCLEEITSRLTSISREKMIDRFDALKRVDFTASNVYALIIWVIKNSNKYFTSQMIDFFYGLSSADNVRNYKSNQRLFEKDDWGYRNRKHDRYTLDYRIVCTQYALPGKSDIYQNRGIERDMRYKISDICTVANNLGFTPGDIDFPADYGKKGYVYMRDGKTILFEFKCYLNQNVHIKLNKEFIKALNVEVARELGWIHSREDIAREFTPEMADGAEKYFDRTLRLDISSTPLLLGNAE